MFRMFQGSGKIRECKKRAVYRNYTSKNILGNFPEL